MNQLGQPPPGSCYIFDGNRQAPPRLKTGHHLRLMCIFANGSGTAPRRDRGSEGKWEGQGSVVSRSKKKKGYTSSPSLFLKVGTTPLPPVGLEVDLGRTDALRPSKGLGSVFRLLLHWFLWWKHGWPNERADHCDKLEERSAA